MEQKTPEQYAKDVLGSLNFSSGNREIRFFQSLNALFNTEGKPAAVHTVLEFLENQLALLAVEQPRAFRTNDQAGLLLQLVRQHFIPAYRDFHKDLLFHQKDGFLFNSFFLAKVFEKFLQHISESGERLTPDGYIEQGKPLINTIIKELNDYIGYRPVPVLEGEAEKHQPYHHEWSAPIPLYIKGIGIANGRYTAVIAAALDIIKQTEPSILRDACFDIDRLEEVVMDARAYDFDHPVNRKPNYHFGIWDPLSFDQDGFYNRFVVHQITVDGILSRIDGARIGESDVAGVPEDELIYEAGAVLAGTMLMGSGVCGSSPGTYTSDTSLNDLMPIIAGYRDAFYEMLLVMMPPKMKPRIKAEQARLFQPFGGCRQALNRQMAKRRADQLQRMHLARLYARIGYSESAMQQAEIINVASARILTTADCHITATHILIDSGKLEQAAAELPKIEDLIRRGIACGAIVDPWTMLGFGGTFSLFHNVDNAIHDHRVDNLINLAEEVFDLYSRLEKEAAAAGNGDLQADLSDRMSELASWWDNFGSTEVEDLESFSGFEVWESAAVVSTALAVWCKAGAAAGDIVFWNRHVDRFKSPKAFVLLAEALLDQQDPAASMSLLMYWLNHSDDIALIDGDYSFHSIALRWLEQVWDEADGNGQEMVPEYPVNNKSRRKTIRKDIPPLPFEERWKLTKRFFEFIEANAGEYWDVPALELDDGFFGGKKAAKDVEHPDTKKPRKKRKSEDEESPFSALYDEMPFHDTADDGIDGSMLDVPVPGGDDDLEITHETERISDRLTFMMTMGKLWKYAVERVNTFSGSNYSASSAQTAADWLPQITSYTDGLIKLLQRVSEYVVPPPAGTADSLLNYDRHRGTKEVLIDRIIWTLVEMRDAKMILTAFITAAERDTQRPKGDEWEPLVLTSLTAVFRNDIKTIKSSWEPMLRQLSKETILHVPTSRGGSAHAIVRCRCVQQALIRLMEYAPRLGLLPETFALLETIQEMEEINTLTAGSITEFDRLVETAVRAMTRCVCLSAKSWTLHKNPQKNQELRDTLLVHYLEQFSEILLSNWLSHSKQIRISPVESIMDRGYWDEIKRFVQTYGADIFTQQNMGFGNLRAMLHQGVGNYLQSLLKIRHNNGEVEIANKLLNDLDRKKIDWESASVRLEIILECVAENYSEYVDYNSTTTHSDHGEKLYMLLDLLRVLVGYERVSWNLKPVYWVHDAMIRCGCDEAAVLWERTVSRRSTDAAEEHIRHYERLSEKYGMWLPSIHERLQERFVRPLQIDRMCGLVLKAVRQVNADGPKTAFDELSAQIENFAKTPLGVGFEMPEWLTALQEEVMLIRLDDFSEGESKKRNEDDELFGTLPHFPQVNITKVALDKMLDTIMKRMKRH